MRPSRARSRIVSAAEGALWASGAAVICSGVMSVISDSVTGIFEAGLRTNGAGLICLFLGVKHYSEEVGLICFL